MTHHDHHHHGHHHEHDHDHDHPDVHQGTSTTLTFEQKFIKLLEHWVKHNDDHARTYREWAHKAQHAGMDQVDRLLQEAAEMTDAISTKFDQAAKLIKPSV
jgi:hypothetical protein